MTVGTDVWPGYEAGYLAERRGFYDKADVNFIQLRSASDVVRAFRNHAIDVAALTLDEALLLQASGVDLKIIFVPDTSNGADAIVAAPHVKSVRDLAGRSVALEEGTIGRYLLTRALQLNSLDPDVVRRVPIAVDLSVKAYESGTVDAVVTFEPFKSQLLARGGHTIFDSRQIPDEIVDVLVVRSDFAETHPNALKALLRGWLKAAEVLARQEPGAMAEIERRLALSPGQRDETFATIRMADLNANRQLLEKEGGISKTAAKLMPILKYRTGQPIQVDMAGLVRADYLPAASP